MLVEIENKGLVYQKEMVLVGESGLTMVGAVIDLLVEIGGDIHEE